MYRISRLSGILLFSSPIFSKLYHNTADKPFANEPELSSIQEQIKFIETLQYRANNPIEDRVTYSKLRSINGYLVSVFDGHGGDLVSEYANNNIRFFL